MAKKAAKRPGRPPKPDKKRFHSAHVAVSDQQLALIRRALKIAGKKPATFVREAGMDLARQIVEQAER